MNFEKNAHLNAIVQDLSEQPVCLENTDGILNGIIIYSHPAEGIQGFP